MFLVEDRYMGATHQVFTWEDPRTSLLVDNLEQFVLSHPACVAQAQWYALADQAATALRELYQRIGAAHVDADPPAEK